MWLVQLSDRRLRGSVLHLADLLVARQSVGELVYQLVWTLSRIRLWNRFLVRVHLLRARLGILWRVWLVGLLTYLGGLALQLDFSATLDALESVVAFDLVLLLGSGFSAELLLLQGLRVKQLGLVALLLLLLSTVECLFWIELLGSGWLKAVALGVDILEAYRWLLRDSVISRSLYARLAVLIVNVDCSIFIFKV